jgi:ferritin
MEATTSVKSSIMTLSDITEKLKAELPDEIEGGNSYLSMAIAANDMNHHDLALYLSEIAKDEYSHATYIAEYLTKNGIGIGDACKKNMEELDTRFRQQFR